MTKYRYILEPYKGMNTRYRCPNCQQKNKTFSRYIDCETGEHIHSTVGRCDRENNCGYHYTPREYFENNNISSDKSQFKTLKTKTVTVEAKSVSFIPVEIFKASLNLALSEENYFVQYLVNLFDVEVASELVSIYFIGTSKHWKGATDFWQIDLDGNIRTGKKMLYNPNSGKRVKEPFNHISWEHCALKQSGFQLKQCLFGEHLLIDKTKPVGVVEAAKTAVIARGYLPQFIWVAVGGLNELNAEKCSVLKGRTVILFPDLNGFEKWSKIAKELSYLATFVVSDLLERKATEEERREGLDFADYLIKYDFKDFILSESQTFKTVSPAEAQEELIDKEMFKLFDLDNCLALPKNSDEEDRNKEIVQFENYFFNRNLLVPPIKLNQCTVIVDLKRFVESHLIAMKAHIGSRSYIPYRNRMLELIIFLNNVG